MTAPAPEQPPIDACWNRVGVWGSAPPRCDRLAELIHCRHCEVYAEAARKLRDRPPPADYLDTGRRHYAEPLIPQGRGGRIAVLVFRVGPEWLALPAGTIEEIIEPVAVHGLPHRSGGPLLGIVNIRGRIRLGVSLDELLGIEGEPPPARQERRRIYPRTVVLRPEDGDVAFAADEVWGTHRYAPPELLEIPAALTRGPARFSSGLLNLEGMRIVRLEPALLSQALEERLR